MTGLPEPRLNRTEAFYRGEAPSLFWEMTVCQCLGRAGSPYQRALAEPAPYGALVARYLARVTGRRRWEAVVEIGGGYGTLMEAFLDEARPGAVTMVDLSPRFLAEQQRALAGRAGCRFVEADAVAFLERLNDPVDLVIANENLGDLPTATGLRRDRVLRAAAGASDPPGPLTARVAGVVRRYGLDLSDAPETFAFNLGAVGLLEALAGRARVAFLVEHSSDVVLPEPYGFLPLEPGHGYPRRVPLKDHDEYTIRFAVLEAVARRLGFRVHRFHLAEAIGLRSDEGIRFMARTGVTSSETAEVVHEFCGHVAEYQGMILVDEGMRDGEGAQGLG